MSRRRHKKPTRREQPAKPSGQRKALIAGILVLAVGIIAILIFLHGGGPRGTSSPVASGAAPVAPVAPGFGTLHGRWLRPDGGYILEIRSIDASGKIDAGYFNPQPIHVARAEAAYEGSTLKVFAELRAPGYPGSTYTLTYDPQRDQLAGTYFQAALRQSFEVVFGRVK